MLGLAFFISGDPNIGTGFELQAIAAAGETLQTHAVLEAMNTGALERSG